MQYNATHRRNLSAPTVNTPIDPSPLNPSTTIQEISTHFSRLYLNHKACSFIKPSTHPPPPIATHLHPDSTAVSTAVILTKSQSQRTSGAKNRANYPCYDNVPQEQEESIKKAIVISSKKPTKNIKGYVNSTIENEEKMTLQKGYAVKMQSLTSIGIDRGKRRSFGCVEMANFLAFNGVKVVSADMPLFMQIHAVDVTRKKYDSLEKFTAKTLALTLKTEFDGIYGPAWHCIVGLSFGSFVTHSVGGFLYFSMDQKLFVLLFKTSVQRAH